MQSAREELAESCRRTRVAAAARTLPLPTLRHAQDEGLGVGKGRRLGRFAILLLQRLSTLILSLSKDGGRGLRNRLMRLAAPALVAAAVLVAAPGLARADPADDALAHFAADKFPETEKGIDALPASGIATAPAILAALGEQPIAVRSGDPKTVLRRSGGHAL